MYLSIGDSVGDIAMSEGLPHEVDNIIKIGIYNISILYLSYIYLISIQLSIYRVFK
jgi:hypothetical protein